MKKIMWAVTLSFVLVGNANAGVWDSFKNTVSKMISGSGTDVFEISFELLDLDNKPMKALPKDPPREMASLWQQLHGHKFRCDLRKEETRFCSLVLEGVVRDTTAMSVSQFFKNFEFELIVKGFERAPDEYEIFFKSDMEGVTFRKYGNIRVGVGGFGKSIGGVGARLKLTHYSPYFSKKEPYHTTREKLLKPEEPVPLLRLMFKDEKIFGMRVMARFKEIDP